MARSDQSRFIKLTDWFAAHAILISLICLALVLLAAVFPIRAEIFLAIIGGMIFVVAVLIHGRAFLMREMKSTEDLGFERHRDLIAYMGSSAGMDWRFIALGFGALFISFAAGSGALGHATNAGCVLAFAIFALLGATARLSRVWPCDNQNTRDQSKI